MNTTDFRSLILAQAGVSAAVGVRVYPVVIPLEVWDSATKKPCIVYRVESVGRSQTFCGTDDLYATSVHVSCYARSYDAAAALGDLVAQMVDFRGIVGQTSFGPVFLDTETDLMDEEPGLFRRVLLFTVWHRSA